MKYILYSILLFCTIGYAQSDLKDLTLKRYIELVSDNSYELKQSAAEISVEKSLRLKGISPPSPVVSFNYDFIPSGSSISAYEERSISLSQSFDFPLKYFIRSQKNSYLINASEVNYQITRNNLLKNIKNVFFKALANKYFLDIYSRHLTSADEFYSKSLIRKNSGEGSSLELLTAQLQLTESKSLYSSAAGEFNSSLQDLMALAGTGNNTDTVTFADTIKYIQLDYDLNSILESALKENYELIRNTLLDKSASANHKLAYLSLLPDFNFSYSKQAISGNNNFYGISFGASIPLWFMFNQNSEINTASLEKEITGYKLSRSYIEVTHRIKKAFKEVKTKEEQLLLYKDSLMPQADEIYNIAMLNYSAGESSYLELLQARQSLLSVKLNYVNNLLNYYMALIELESSVNMPSFKILE